MGVPYIPQSSLREFEPDISGDHSSHERHASRARRPCSIGIDAFPFLEYSFSLDYDNDSSGRRGHCAGNVGTALRPVSCRAFVKPIHIRHDSDLSAVRCLAGIRRIFCVVGDRDEEAMAGGGGLFIHVSGAHVSYLIGSMDA